MLWLRRLRCLLAKLIEMLNSGVLGLFWCCLLFRVVNVVIGLLVPDSENFGGTPSDIITSNATFLHKILWPMKVSRGSHRSGIKIQTQDIF